MKDPLAKWPTIDEAAAKLRVSKRTIQLLLSKRTFTSAKRPQPGKKPATVIDPADIEAWQTRPREVKPALLPAGEMPGAALASPADDRRLPAVMPNAGAAADFAEQLGAAIARALTAVKPSDQIFTPTEAAIYSKRTVATLGKLRNAGTLPNAGSKRHPLYRRRDLDNL